MDLYKKTKKRSKHQLVTDLYRNQLVSARRRSMDKPNYTNKQLQKWVNSQPLFQTLYNNWIESECTTKFVPSIDRIDDSVSYTLTNIVLMTWEDNLKKSWSDRRNGVNNKVSMSIVGEQISSGIKVEFPSISSAARYLKVNKGQIHHCINGRQKQTGGYTWKYCA